MPEELTALLDPASFAIVTAGTVLACAARCGWRGFGAATAQAGGLLRRGFDADANRRALAVAVNAIERDGSHRADPPLPPDRALGLMLESYLRHGTIEALDNARRRERAAEAARIGHAAQVFAWAGDLAPVFGMIGTLYGLTQLAPSAAGSTAAAIMGAVSTAVLTSLYGALIAHLVCFPLAAAIERRGLACEAMREELADWFVERVMRCTGPSQGRARLRGVA